MAEMFVCVAWLGSSGTRSTKESTQASRILSAVAGLSSWKCSDRPAASRPAPTARLIA